MTPASFQGFSATNGVERVEQECYQVVDGAAVVTNQCETPPSGSGTHSAEGNEHVVGAGVRHHHGDASSGGSQQGQQADQHHQYRQIYQQQQYQQHDKISESSEGSQLVQHLGESSGGSQPCQQPQDRKSRYRGVSYDRKKAKWRVQIKVAALGKSGVSVGYYDTEESAARAYDRAAIGLLGRSAPQLQTNFCVSEYVDEEIQDLGGKTREEVKSALKSEREKKTPRRRFASQRQRTSQFMGVGSSNRKNQWQARILVHGKVTHLGYYETEEEAARVYDRVSLALNGNAAQTNFSLEEYPEEDIKPFVGLDRESLQRALGVKPMDKSSKYRGVSKKKGKWEAKVMVNRRWAYRELFDSEEAAAVAYDKALWRLKPSEAASYVNFKDRGGGGTCGADVAGPSALRVGRTALESTESAEYDDDYDEGFGDGEDGCDRGTYLIPDGVSGELPSLRLWSENHGNQRLTRSLAHPRFPLADSSDEYYSSDGDFEYEYKPTRGTSRSEAMRAKKASTKEIRDSRESLSLRKAAPSPVRTKKAESKSEHKAGHPKFAMVPGEGMKFVTNSGAGTSLESASTPLADNGMIPNLSTSSFHDQKDLMIRVGSETHLVPPVSNALPIHEDAGVSYRKAARQSHPGPARLRGVGMKRATSEPYISSLQDMEDPFAGMDDLMNDSDVLFGKGVDLGLLTGSQGAGSLDEMGGIGRMGDGMGNIMDQDLMHIQNFVHDQEVAVDGVAKSHPEPQSHLVFDEAEETALHGLEFQPKPRKLSKSVSMTNLVCDDISQAASIAVAAGPKRMPVHPGRVASIHVNGRPPTMPSMPHIAAPGAPVNTSGNTTPSGLRRVNTFTCSFPSLEEAEFDQTPRIRTSSHNSSDEDLVKQLWAGEAHVPSLRI